MATWQFPPASNPNWNHTRPPPGRDPLFQPPPNVGSQHRALSSCTGAPLSSPDHNDQAQLSLVNWSTGQGPTGGRSTELSQLTGHAQQSGTGNAPVMSHTYFDPFQGNWGISATSLPGEEMSQTNLSSSQITPPESSASLLSVQSPPNCPVRHSAPHDWQAMQAFTQRSNNPNEFLRGLLECFLHSEWMHNQDREPRMSDDYSKHVLRQVANLTGCPPVDYNDPKKSLLTVFVGNSDGRPSCLFCDKPTHSIPRALSCVRSHLHFKPFRCEGCQSCNQENGYAAFWSAALLRDHLSAQKIVTCTKCGKKLRQGSIRRHQATLHNSTLGHLQYPKHPAAPSYDSSEEEEVEELIDFLLDDEESD